MAEQAKPAASPPAAAPAAAPKEKKHFKEKEEKKAPEANKELENEVLVRIMGNDIPGSKKIYAGLTRIKGVSWAISNFVTKKLNLPIDKKIQELSKEDIKKIEEFLRKLPVYDFFKNRRNDRETGVSSHLYGADLELKRDFDIKRLRAIKSYKGIRHMLKQPVRGQSTRSHFRERGRLVGVQKKSSMPAPKPKPAAAAGAKK